MNKRTIEQIVIFANLESKLVKEQTIKIIDYLQTREKKIKVLLDADFHSFLFEDNTPFYSEIEILRDNDFTADLVLSIGGDGTFLSSAARVGNKSIPILGINTGRLGFLADISKEDIISSLESVFNQEFTIEKRTVLEVETIDGKVKENAFALNDVAISKQDSSSMLLINACYQNELINSYQGDGLIISTPTGSTAYSMSVGGPIVVPQTSNLLITPVASHSLTVRPLVIPNDWTIELEVVSRSNSYLVSVDGHSKVVHNSTRIHIKKADHTVKVVKPKGHTFFNTLRNKLLWGADVRNG